MKRLFLTAAALALSAGIATAQVAYTINGMPVDPLTQAQLYNSGFPPGHYAMDMYGNLMLVGEIGTYLTPNGYVENGTANQFSGGTWFGGSGQINPDGSGSYYNPNTGAGYGTDGSGCYYVGDWSNC